MQSLGRMLQAFLAVSMGMFMLVLAFSRDYWQYLNPKYAWLTMVSGALVALLAAAGFTDRARKPSLTVCLGLAAFLLIVYTSLNTPNPLLEPAVPDVPASDPGAAPITPLESLDAPPEGPSRLNIAGHAYVKINVAELILQDDRKQAASGDRFVLRGIVRRTPELDAVGYVAVTRLLVTCCFADAVAVGVPVKVDDPGAFEEGAWVRAAGRLEATPAAFPKTALTVPGAMATRLSETFVLTAENVEFGHAADPPFIFDLRDEEPFAY
jgi:hypothetical protein